MELIISQYYQTFTHPLYIPNHSLIHKPYFESYLIPILTFYSDHYIKNHIQHTIPDIPVSDLFTFFQSLQILDKDEKHILITLIKENPFLSSHLLFFYIKYVQFYMLFVDFFHSDVEDSLYDFIYLLCMNQDKIIKQKIKQYQKQKQFKKAHFFILFYNMNMDLIQSFSNIFDSFPVTLSISPNRTSKNIFLKFAYSSWFQEFKKNKLQSTTLSKKTFLSRFLCHSNSSDF
jgi:hypothetical protein